MLDLYLLLVRRLVKEWTNEGLLAVLDLSGRSCGRGRILQCEVHAQDQRVFEVQDIFNTRGAQLDRVHHDVLHHLIHLDLRSVLSGHELLPARSNHHSHRQLLVVRAIEVAATGALQAIQRWPGVRLHHPNNLLTAPLPDKLQRGHLHLVHTNELVHANEILQLDVVLECHIFAPVA